MIAADRTFVVLGELPGQAVILLPSLAELKRSTASRPDAQSDE